MEITPTNKAYINIELVAKLIDTVDIRAGITVKKVFIQEFIIPIFSNGVFFNIITLNLMLNIPIANVLISKLKTANIGKFLNIKTENNIFPT
ncbi:hypothetical protein BG262_00500 [Floricoccus penangensis]|uniref:Uncharacterized protein n=1 Tax=Floricoccus penangensis TaxID=1859475 RepID=A0A9Q5P0Q4_9LACT|nr:hypothetical protein BG262_00500 [Floricoccus penangensis]